MALRTIRALVTAFRKERGAEHRCTEAASTSGAVTGCAYVLSGYGDVENLSLRFSCLCKNFLFWQHLQFLLVSFNGSALTG